jgi:hypothetical protein
MEVSHNHSTKEKKMSKTRFPIGFYTSLIKGDALETKRSVAFYYSDNLRIGTIDGVGKGPNGHWVRLKIGPDFRTFSLKKIQGPVTIGKCTPKE